MAFKIDGHDMGIHEPSKTKTILDGVQHRFTFSNGHEASVVRHSCSYGGERGLWEIAILDSDGDLNYDTPITDNVLGYVQAANILGILDRISKL